MKSGLSAFQPRHPLRPLWAMFALVGIAATSRVLWNVYSVKTMPVDVAIATINNRNSTTLEIDGAIVQMERQAENLIAGIRAAAGKGNAQAHYALSVLSTIIAPSNADQAVIGQIRARLADPNLSPTDMVAWMRERLR